MRFPYAKLHGAGNSYVYVDARGLADAPDWPAVARGVADAATGLGGDGLIVIGRDEEAVCSMRIFNRDGSEAEFCGNGVRALGKYLFDRGQTGRTFQIATRAGRVPIEVLRTGREGATLLAVGVRRPVVLDAAGAYVVPLPGGDMGVVRVDVGNPHAVLFRSRMPNLGWLRRVGPEVSQHSLFPAGVNFHVAAVRTPSRVRVWHYERGSGETRACGSGALAVFAAGRVLGLLDAQAEVKVPGGALVVEDAGAKRVRLIGPAVEVSRGFVSVGRSS